MICIGIDPTDPRSRGPCTYSVGARKRELIALGTLERGRECDELVEVIERHHVEAVAVEVAREIYLMSGAEEARNSRRSCGRSSHRTFSLVRCYILHASTCAPSSASSAWTHS